MQNYLQGKNILIGVSGSIAVQKVKPLLELLSLQGCNVKLVFTTGALHLCTSDELSHLQVEIYSEIFNEIDKLQMDHITLAKWADILLIAPASASILSRCVTGLADQLLSLIYLATKAKVYFAPAMNQAMWSKAAVQDNVEILQQRGDNILGPAFGEQACGDVGFGRMLEPCDIVAQINNDAAQFAKDLNILLTAGPTEEAIDPVRYISNRSSGKMGYAIATAFAEQGANVTLISGPTSLSRPKVKHFIRVDSAANMLAAVQTECESADIFISAAAVADYKIKNVAKDKLKKTESPLSLELEPTADIIKTIREKYPDLFIVGFALETKNTVQSALKKLQHKKMNIIVANEYCSENPVFGSDENSVQILQENQKPIDLQQKSKRFIAQELVKIICKQFLS